MGLHDLVCANADCSDPSEAETFQTVKECEVGIVPERALCEVCDLVVRIDALLFSLEKPARALALACRDDLDLLPILADWCDDNGLPASSAELRHLHGLVRCLR
jgi:hypothetical protein